MELEVVGVVGVVNYFERRMLLMRKGLEDPGDDSVPAGDSKTTDGNVCVRRRMPTRDGPVGALPCLVTKKRTAPEGVGWGGGWR